MKQLLLLSACVLFRIALLNAQPYHPYLNIPVTHYGNTLVNPWAGGFDAPIFSTIDLNGDGIKDLFVFEKGGDYDKYHHYYTFLNMGTPNQTDYVFAPEYIKCFPPFMGDWVLLVDYDCDGKEDVFTYPAKYGVGGMNVYRNDGIIPNTLSFNETYDYVRSSYFSFSSNLYISRTNQPALIDLDNDGDLDVLTIALGSSVIEYHRNYAEEQLGRCDTLVMVLEKSCWGQVCLTGVSNDAILNCPDSVGCYPGPNLPANYGQQYVRQLQKFYETEEANSNGGTCILGFDIDGDSDKDVVNGDLLGDNLLFLKNGGTPDTALITYKDALYPSYDTSVIFRTFPAAYYFDADNDGKKDLVVSGCIAGASRNYKNVLFYKNTTNNQTNVFHYIKDSLIVEDMIDVGTGAKVALTDIDGDGLQDMIIGNYNYKNQYTANDHAALAYYRNTGTSTQPSFALVTKDFSNLSSAFSGVFGLYPTFGDLDGDGDSDMIIGGEDGFLYYLTNTGNANYVLSIVHIHNSNGDSINCGSYATPCLVDLNRDGLLDLVIGEKNGNLNYYENTGTTTAFSFTLVTTNLGGVSVVKAPELYGYSAPYFFDGPGNNYKLYVGSLSGFVYTYDNIDNNIAGTFHLVDSMLIYEPIRSTVAGADINNDGVLDLLVGNNSGGVTWYSYSTISVNEISSSPASFNIYPNPVKDFLFLNFDNENSRNRYEVTVSDIIGKTVFSGPVTNSSKNIDARKWTNGMYICRITGKGTVLIKKFVVRH